MLRLYMSGRALNAYRIGPRGRRSEVQRSDTGRSRVHREAKCARIEILWTGAGVVELAALEKR